MMSYTQLIDWKGPLPSLRIPAEGDMRIPLYWSKATAEELQQKGPSGFVFLLEVFRRQPGRCPAVRVGLLRRRPSSDLSETNPPIAIPTATATYRCERKSSSDLKTSQGDLYAAVTRNAYGSLVLNAARACSSTSIFPNRKDCRPGKP